MTPPPDVQRRNAYLRGLDAEFRCVLLLRLKGYRILARRFKCQQGEIDIVALRGRTLAMIEVKARPSVREALESISPRQQLRIIHAANAFLGRQKALGGHDCRFDLIWVGPGMRMKHIMDAWRG